MKLGAVLSRLNRVQHGLPFKVIASIIAAVLCIGYASWQAVAAADRAVGQVGMQVETEGGERRDAAEVLRELEADPETRPQADELRAQLASIRGVNEVLARSQNWTAHVAGAGIALALMLAVIWLGLGLTGLALWLGLTLIVAPLWLIGVSLPASVPIAKTLKAAALFLYALGVLAFSFSVLMTLLRIAFSAPSPILAVARNVAMEAVRLKVSLLFIVILIFALAALPSLLDQGTPLRYRVQAFMQYGVGGTFWIIAILTVFLAVGTVAFEQRDRIIWQTITKPVAAWQYLLGKWLGVVGVAAVMLAVSGSGVFLFTEYLRMQPAVGEAAAFVPAEGGRIWTEDRRVLETQVLSARRLVQPRLPELNMDAVQQEVDRRLQTTLAADPEAPDTLAARQQVFNELLDEIRGQYYSVPPPPPDQPGTYGLSDEYVFSGLGKARDEGRSLTLRYQINVGANDPRTTYRILIAFGDMEPIPRNVAVGQALNEPVPPSAVYPNGDLRVYILNGGDTNPANPDETISFPPEGLQVFYAAGSYRINYMRVFVVLWLKLAFIAMIGVVSATFLSFPVAALVSFGIFLMAEGSGFLLDEIQYFGTGKKDEAMALKVLWAIVRIVAWTVGNTFRFYSELKPTSNLVEGRLVGWWNVTKAAGLFSALCFVLYAAGVLIFRRRELAIYSGN